MGCELVPEKGPWEKAFARRFHFFCLSIWLNGNERDTAGQGLQKNRREGTEFTWKGLTRRDSLSACVHLFCVGDFHFGLSIPFFPSFHSLLSPCFLLFVVVGLSLNLKLIMQAEGQTGGVNWKAKGRWKEINFVCLKKGNGFTTTRPFLLFLGVSWYWRRRSLTDIAESYVCWTPINHFGNKIMFPCYKGISLSFTITIQMEASALFLPSLPKNV